MKYVLYTFLACAWFAAQAQNETNNWFFGHYCGLDFSVIPPVPLSGSVMHTNEGSSTASDPITGDLLFYSDGMQVYDATHTQMPNGDGLMGNFSSTQACLIVPKPGPDQLFYVFTSDAIENGGAAGYRYSIVDMALNGGLGDVTVKNQLLFAPSTEKLCAVRHANCNDWWIMTKESGNNVFRAYLLTDTGLAAPVVTAIGSAGAPVSSGQAKFSPDGTKFAITEYYGMVLELFDFDASTGVLSNPVVIPQAVTDHGYGLSFSGDGKKVYAFKGNANQLYQYDLSVATPAAITGSETYLGATVVETAMQLAKDQKIYLAGLGSSLSVIHDPNNAGTACGFSYMSVGIAGWTPYLSICNFPESYFNTISPCGPTLSIYSEGTDISCYGSYDGAASVGIYNSQGPYTVSWSPGGSTAENLSSLAPGVYTVTVTDSTGFSVTQSVTIAEPSPLHVTLNGITQVCFGDEASINTHVTGGTAPFTFTWQTFPPGPDSYFNFYPFSNGTVTVMIEDSNHCQAYDTIAVTLYTPEAFPADTCICAGQSVELMATGAPYYNWSTGESTPSIVVSPITDTQYIVFYPGSCPPDTIHICIHTPSACGSTGLPETAVPGIVIPNIITPNGDGINDVFRIQGLSGASALQVFNRWGNPVFTSDDYQNDWKGSLDGVYYYVLRLANGEVFSGFVQVTGR